MDGVGRTAWRMLVSRKGLLEWQSSGETNGQGCPNLAASFLSMWGAPALATGVTVYLAISVPLALVIAGPILFLWAASPALAWWISQPRLRREAVLTAGQTLFLRKISRKTWAFFETFVGPEDHWLPPDNCQEYRGTLVAHPAMAGRGA